MFATILSAIRNLRNTGSKRSLPRNTRTHLSLELLEDRLIPSTTAAPAAPAFTATTVSAAQINLYWSSVSGVTSYQIEEAVNGAWKQINSVASSYGGTEIIGLTAGTTYDFDVVATNAAGSTWGTQKLATTLTAAPAFTATTVSPGQINLYWTAVPGATSYQIEIVINGAWKQIVSLAGSTTSQGITGLAAGTTYDFDVVATNSGGSTWGTQKFATTVQVNHPVAAAAYSPVTGSLFGPNGPSPLDVQQGADGDCWVMSSLAAVAARNPRAIENMFTYIGTTVENGSTVGLYTVRFFNSAGKAEYVTVDTELPSAGAYYDHPINGVLWAALAEKAYAEANGAGYVTTEAEGSDSYAALNSGQPGWVLQAITGLPASYISINPTNIAAAWKADHFIVLASNNTPNSPYIVGGHAYAVVGYNPLSSQPFEVFNPWGGTTSSVWCPENTQYYGLFSANASFLAQNFQGQFVASGIAPSRDLSNDLLKNAVILDAGSSGLIANTGHRHQVGGLSNTPAAIPSQLISGLAAKAAETQPTAPSSHDAIWTEMDNLKLADLSGQSLFSTRIA